MELRDYQQRAIDMLYDWFRANDAGHPCLVLPTGSGKSHIVAALCRDALQSWPGTRVLMLTHTKELIGQNAEKMRQHWPGAPMGIYSAGIGRRELGEPITFAGIQSVRTRAAAIGHIDLLIVDEAHTISHKEEGGYRKLINGLLEINQEMRIIGLTATPYRLGHGLITEKPALFDALIEPVSIEELVYKGYLAPLKSKVTEAKLDTSGVHKRGGEFIESELQAAVDTADNNYGVVQEVIRRAGDRRAWLFFCTGVSHAENIAAVLKNYDIPAACITGETPKTERARIIEEFKTGNLRALTNANVLTTGFDYPDIDLIAMLRPTMSPGLYVQMAGRGMRPKSHTDHCKVLDFAGVVAMHGPITAVQIPDKKSAEGGQAPVKTCPQCEEICHASVRSCPACGWSFPIAEKELLQLRNDDIMGLETQEMAVTAWRWRVHTSRTSGLEMLAVTYYGDLSDKPITEYFPVLHEGYAGNKAKAAILTIALQAGEWAAYDMVKKIGFNLDTDELAVMMSRLPSPATIEYRRDGKFYRVISRAW